MTLFVLVIAAAAVVAALACSLRILREYERAVVFRLGRLLPVRGPGLVMLIPAVDRMVRVDLRTVTLRSEATQRAMARQAEAERERCAKIINAEGELQAAGKLAGAAEIIGAQPPPLHLRSLQTLLEVGADQGSTIVFPLPLDLLAPFRGTVEAAAGRNGASPRTADRRADAAQPR